MKQALMALDYMREHGSITSLDAMRDLGIMSFPKRICELRADGYEIEAKKETVLNRYGNKVSINRYYLMKEVEQ